jgi:hypothetical protein
LHAYVDSAHACMPKWGALQAVWHVQNIMRVTANGVLLQTWLGGSTVAFGTKDDKIVLLDADTLRVKKTVFLPLSGRQPGSNPHEVVVSEVWPASIFPLAGSSGEDRAGLRTVLCTASCKTDHGFHSEMILRCAVTCSNTVASGACSKMRAAICLPLRAAARRRPPSSRCRIASQSCGCG